MTTDEAVLDDVGLQVADEPSSIDLSEPASLSFSNVGLQGTSNQIRDVSGNYCWRGRNDVAL